MRVSFYTREQKITTVMRKRSMQIPLSEKVAHRLRGSPQEGSAEGSFWTGMLNGKRFYMLFSKHFRLIPVIGSRRYAVCPYAVMKKGGTAFIRPLLEQFRWRAFCLMASQRILCAEVKVYVLNTLYLSIKISTAQLEIFSRDRAFHKTRKFLLCKETWRFSKHSWKNQGNAALFNL